MNKRTEANKFNITVVIPSKESKTKYDTRVAKAIAKILIETLPSKRIEELVEAYKRQKKSGQG